MNNKKGEKRINKKKRKIPEVLTYDEKRKFVQTLLIIAGLLVAFNSEYRNIILFVVFIIASLVYLIWIAIAEKADVERKKESRFMIFNAFFSSLLAFSFSGYLAVMGLFEIIFKIGTIMLSFVAILAIYALLGSLLAIVLASRND